MNNFKPLLSALVVMSLSACTGQFSVTPNANGTNTNGTSTSNTTGTNGTSTTTTTTTGGTTTVNTAPIDNGTIASGSTGLLSAVFKTSVKAENFPLTVEKNGVLIGMSKYMYKPGEQVSLKYTVPATYSDYAWVGVIPSRVTHGDERTNDENDVAYKYVDTLKSGVLNFTLPEKSGLYDFRLMDKNDATGTEVASLSFIVSESTTITDATIRLQKNVFKQSEKINVDFTAPLETLMDNPWIGVVPSNIPHGDSDLNDQYDVSYKYVDGKAIGTVIFDNGYAPGTYDIRMMDKDAKGKELTYISFTIVAD